MSRDLKGGASSAPKKRTGLLMGVMIGLMVGILVAAGLAWYVTRVSFGNSSKDTPAPAPKLVQAAVVAEVKDTVPVQPLPLPGKPGDKIGDEPPRYEFYNVLPGDPKTGKGTEPSHVPIVTDKTISKSSEQVYLQVGAFQKPAEADNMKARLALMGLEAGIQSVNIPEKGMMHRVRLGPFKKADDATTIRNQLAQAGIAATVVKAN